MLFKMLCFLAFLCLLGVTDAGQERVKLLNIFSDPTPMVLQSWSHTGSPVAVSVDSQHLEEISSSVLNAENWLRTHVLTHFPAVQVTTIVVGENVLCNNSHESKWDLVLPSVRNIYHSIVRWGLEKEIKVSASLSTECLHPFTYSYRHDLADRVIKPLLEFLQTTNSSFSVNAPLDFSPLVTAHKESIRKLGDSQLSEIYVVISGTTKGRKPKSRKLSFLSSKFVKPFPARPTPSSIHSSIGFSIPAHIAKTPLSPLAQTPPSPDLIFPFSPQSSPLASFPPQSSPHPSMSSPLAPQVSPPSPPSPSYSFAPQNPPLVMPSNPPHDLTYPPCYAPPRTTQPPTVSPPAPTAGEEKGLWCVAKPSVPEEKLQEAMDYACGAGGADCEEIKPHGSCYNPDTMVAHASYAFNSYWQKNKNIGGTCNFGGTAMVINANPSFEQCRFILS
ncbi:hypothetical protein ACHQM5_024941 [Ranunculus cassubicifolius]